MSTTVRERPADTGKASGGMAARRAVIRWAWRLFRREWRQQLLVLALNGCVGCRVACAANARLARCLPASRAGAARSYRPDGWRDQDRASRQEIT
jgi:hypothetical protein